MIFLHHQIQKRIIYTLALAWPNWICFRSEINCSLLFNDVNNYLLLFSFFLFTYAWSPSQNVRLMTLIVFEYVYIYTHTHVNVYSSKKICIPSTLFTYEDGHQLWHDRIKQRRIWLIWMMICVDRYLFLFSSLFLFVRIFLFIMIIRRTKKKKKKKLYFIINEKQKNDCELCL